MNIIRYPQQADWKELLKRPALNTEILFPKVSEILNEVRTKGDEALFEYEMMFDKANLDSLIVSEKEFNEAECKIYLSTHLERDGKEKTVILTIRDNGPGFSEQILEHAFEPYITTKDTGTGLGLPMVKKIIEEHGGWITLANGSDSNEQKSNGAIVTIGFVNLA